MPNEKRVSLEKMLDGVEIMSWYVPEEVSNAIRAALIRGEKLERTVEEWKELLKKEGGGYLVLLAIHDFGEED